MNHNVTLENLTIAGHRIDSPAAMNLETNEHVRNLRIAGTVTTRARGDEKQISIICKSRA